jgi:hypothetical protein
MIFITEILQEFSKVFFGSVTALVSALSNAGHREEKS